MKVAINSKSFMRDMNNIIGYSIGFLEGVHNGKRAFLDSIGKNTIEVLKEYIDASARVNPSMLQHVYEWDQAGSPSSRLFDISYTVSNLGLSVKSSFRQSTTVQAGSTVPFYNKAYIMENGIPVTIKPKNAQALRFEIDGEEKFSKQPVTISSPGGDNAQGGLERAFDEFFTRYFSQSFLDSSGIAKYLESPTAYKNNLRSGKSRGKSAGLTTGYRWIANAGLVG
jgi:hypothetical protein